MTLLKVEHLGIDFGGLRAIDDLSFEIPRGRIFSIIGPNGAGKTTLFNMVSGLYRPSRGRNFFDGEDVTSLAPHKLAARGLSRTFQNLQVFVHMTALENVMVGRHLHEERGALAHLLALPSVQRQNRTTAANACELLAFVGLEGHAERSAAALPYGALKRLEMARALACEPKLLLLDEPAAGCNSAETQELERLILEIAASGVTVALVEHAMKLVMRVSDRILVLNHGRKLAEGTAEEVRANPEVIAAYLGFPGRRGAAHA
jgi:branched-chain amino acid transport system ATP-binding protein